LQSKEGRRGADLLLVVGIVVTVVVASVVIDWFLRLGLGLVLIIFAGYHRTALGSADWVWGTVLIELRLGSGVLVSKAA
jgi:undecaprenyl pyrophosphate phosphatase UppP